MKKRELYLTIGQMAKLHYINKKTLMFYDQINLFSPEFMGENGYRYYTYSQCLLLEKILFLRRLGVSVEDIKHQIKDVRAEDTLVFFSEQRQKNLEHIRLLKEYEKVLKRKEEELQAALLIPSGQIEIKELKEQKFLISRSGMGEDEMSQFFSDILSQVGIQHLYHYSFGTIVNEENLLAGNIVYDRYFVAYRRGMRGVHPMLRPAGTYLVSCWQGEDMVQAYDRIKEYARIHNLLFCGDAFEIQLIDEFSTSAREEFKYEISVPVKRVSLSDSK